MSKITKIERILYVIIMSIFLISAFFPVCKPLNSDLPSDRLISYYSVIFDYSSPSLQLFNQILLSIPLLCIITADISILVELGQKRINNPVEYIYGISIVVFCISGLLFSSITDSMLPFGMIVLAIGFGFGMVRLIFHFGFRGLRV